MGIYYDGRILTGSQDTEKYQRQPRNFFVLYIFYLPFCLTFCFCLLLIHNSLLEIHNNFNNILYYAFTHTQTYLRK